VPPISLERHGVADVAKVQGPAARPKFPSSVVFCSDKDLWPEELGAPRPISSVTRVKLRRLQRFFAVRAQECEEDAAEATSHADSFKKNVPSAKSLREHAEALHKEAKKLRKDWAAAVRQVLEGDSKASHEEQEKQQEEGKRQRQQGSIMPVQVQGLRWYCACIRSGQADGAATENEKVLRRLGPLRPTESEAVDDLRQLTGTVREDGSEKRRRLSSKEAEVPSEAQ